MLKGKEKVGLRVRLTHHVFNSQKGGQFLRSKCEWAGLLIAMAF
jgi:hypothetical protein